MGCILLVAHVALANHGLPPVRLSQYARHTWTGLNGLPENSVLAMTLGAEGAVMLSTEVGPFRFDGVHFTALRWNGEGWGRVASSMVSHGRGLFVGSEVALVHLTGPGTPDVIPLPDDCGGAIQLEVDGTGTPWWVCFRGGVMRLGPAGVEPVTAPGVARWLYRADDGAVWLASDSGVTVYRDGRPHKTWTELDGLPGPAAYSVARRRGGGVWVGTSRGLGFIDEAGQAHLAALEGRPVGAVIELADGSVWGALLPGGKFEDGLCCRRNRHL